MPAGGPLLIGSDAPTAAAGGSATSCAAVVVHYRGAPSTLACLASLEAQGPRVGIVVVDNCSPDGSRDDVERAVAALPGGVSIRAPHNGGFGAGCNLGIATALTRWPELSHVLLLNPDAELEPGALAEMLATAARHPAAGVVGCHIDDGNGRTWFANGRFPRWTLSGFHCAPPARAEHRTGFVTGACMLLSADLLRAGLRFDESFFLYGEDADLCLEVLARGRELWITQHARARHQGGGSQPGQRVLGELTADRLFWLSRAKVMLARRHLSRLQRAAFYLIAAVCKPVLGVLRSRSVRFLGPHWRGLASGMRASLARRTAAGGS
jgi:GT2 family glycosyltransferase